MRTGTSQVRPSTSSFARSSPPFSPAQRSAPAGSPTTDWGAYFSPPPAPRSAKHYKRVIRTTTGHRSDHYWSVSEPLLVHSANHYWFTHGPVVVHLRVNTTLHPIVCAITQSPNSNQQVSKAIRHRSKAMIGETHVHTFLSGHTYPRPTKKRTFLLFDSYQKRVLLWQ